MTNVFVTGATGFIGSHVVEENLKRGNNVRGLVLPGDPGEVTLKNKSIEIVYGDIREYSFLEKACENIDVVFHCAGIVTDWAPKDLFYGVNVLGMENLCKAATKAHVKRLVYMSTNDVFGPIEDVVIDETFPLKIWGELYPDTKIEAERIAWKYYKESGLPVSMVYGCWVYGINDKTFVPLIADALVKKELMFWRKDVHVWPTYIDNLIDFLMLISSDPRAIGNGYLIHDGQMVTFQDFSKIIAENLDVEPCHQYIPYWLAKVVAWILERGWKLTKKKTRPLLTTYTVINLGSRLNFSIEKAKRELGWTPKIPFDQGMKETMTWLKTLNRESLKEK